MEETKRPFVSMREDEEEKHICAICREGLSEVGTIDSCPHLFCFTCIKKWSQTENTCPMCKERFTRIKKSWIPGTRRPYRPDSKKKKSSDGHFSKNRMRPEAQPEQEENIARRVLVEAGIIEDSETLIVDHKEQRVQFARDEHNDRVNSSEAHWLAEARTSLLETLPRRFLDQLNEIEITEIYHPVHAPSRRLAQARKTTEHTAFRSLI